MRTESARQFSSAAEARAAGVANQAAARAQEAAQQAAQRAAERAAEQGLRPGESPEEMAARISEQVSREVQQAMSPGNVSVSSQGDRQIIRLGNGREIIINGDEVMIDGEPASTGIAVADHDQIPMVAMQTGKQITLFVCMAIAFIVVGLPIARAFARWLDRRGTVQPGASDTAQRLAAIENAVESVAIEVERISEGQRFTAKLLSDRANERARDGVPVGADRLG